MTRLRMLKTSQFYPAVIDAVYRARPGLRDAPYGEQHAALMGSGFYWADHWKRSLEHTGGYEVEEVVVNAEHLQKQWAREHGVAISPDAWHLEVLSAQIAAFRPDILFFHDVESVPAAFRARLRRANATIRLVIGWDGVAFMDPAKFHGVDLMLSCVDHVTEFYRRRGFQTLLLPLAFEPSLLDRLAPTARSHPVSFVGGVALRSGGHHERLALLARLDRDVDIRLWLSGSAAAGPGLDCLKRGDIAGLCRHVAGVGRLGRLLRRSRGEAFGLAMHQILADSRITVNSHIDVAGARAGNMRLFEATGVGACLLTDWKENLADYFEPDVEVVTYRSAAEAVDKVRYLLAHETARRAIAAAGQARTLSCHTFAHRVPALDAAIRALIDR